MHKLSERAGLDLKAIYISSANQFGVAQADDYAAGLEKTFRFLADYPRAARERTETLPPVRAFPYKSHLVVYVIEGVDILVIRIRHAHEDWLSNPF